MVSYRNGVSIGEILVYVPVLIVAVILTIKHGFGRSSGWLFLVIFSLARIIGPCFQLATIHDPTNTDLYTGAEILQSVGLSPLMLAALGLLSRVIGSISKSRPTFPNARQLLLVHVIVTVGLLLGIVGGINASDKLKDTGRYVPQTASKVGVALFIITYVLLVLSVILTSFKISSAEPGEKRLLLAVALALPFLLVRVIYSTISTYDTKSKTFNLVTGSVTVWLFMALLMELIVVIIFECVGLALQRQFYGNLSQPQEQQANGFSAQPGGQQAYNGGSAQPGEQQAYNGGSAPSQEPSSAYGSGPAPSKGSGILETLGRRTIIGRIITRIMNSGTGRDDVEMQQQH